MYLFQKIYCMVLNSATETYLFYFLYLNYPELFYTIEQIMVLPVTRLIT